jgi:ribokinase
MRYDLLTIGDPTIDTFLKIHDAHLALQVDPGRTQLCIDYADKIPVDEYHRLAAGGCVNVAVSASRLGLATAVYGFVGDDVEGKAVVTELEGDGVSADLVAIDRERGTNASTAVVFRGERTIFVWHQHREYLLPELPPVEWIYLTSVGPPSPAVKRLHDAVCAEVDRTSALLAFAPGTHQLRMGAGALAGLLRRSRLLLLNRREAGELTGREGASPEELLAALHALGPQTVVMTDGPSGSHASDGTRLLRTGIMDSPIVDRTGAGDAYGSALLVALHLDRPLAEAMAWGTVQAAHCVTAFGATPGLVGRAELEADAARHPELAGRPPAVKPTARQVRARAASR